MAKTKKATELIVSEEYSLVLRTAKADGTSHSDFKWPAIGPVEAADWKPTAKCGNGLHGLLWGTGDWSLLNQDDDALWQVVKVKTADIVHIDAQKIKFPRGEVVYTGAMADAFAMVLCDLWHVNSILEATKNKNESGDSAQIGSSGDSAQIGSSGDSAQIGSSGYSAKIGSSGYYAKIGSSGDSAQIGSSGYYAKIGSSGDYAQIGSSGDSAKIGSSRYYAKIGSSGDYAQIGSSGDSAQIGSSGDSAKIEAKGKKSIVAAVGLNSIVAAGEDGCIAASWWDEKKERFRLLVGYVGEDGIIPNTQYKAEKGNWVKVK